MSKESQREALSALMDGELPAAEAARVLDAMRDDPELREQWARHHRLSGLLSGHSELVGDGDVLADRIREALDREPVPLKRRRKNAGSGAPWPVSRRLALAACVVLAVLVVVLGLSGDPVPAPGPGNVAGTAVPAEPGPAPVTVAARTPAPVSAESTRLTWNDARPRVEARLNAYLLNHNEYLSEGVRGMLPYARVVGYDVRN